MRTLLIVASLAAMAFPASAQQAQERLIDYPAFAELTGEVAAYRQGRLVTLAEFRERAAKAGTLILDTRSAAAFAEGHIKGAVNLPFSDFTDEKLAKVIGNNPGREILIYCNNNFRDNIAPVVTKRPPLALNIPTFINLYGYGYRNIYELDGAYSIADAQIEWVSAETL